MKLRTLAVLGVTSLFAFSLAYAAPTTTLTAEDSNELAMNDTVNTPGMNDANGAAGNVGGLQNNDNTQLSDNSNTESSDNLALDTTANSNDDISADTATGDDDY